MRKQKQSLLVDPKEPSISVVTSRYFFLHHQDHKFLDNGGPIPLQTNCPSNPPILCVQGFTCGPFFFLALLPSKIKNNKNEYRINPTRTPVFHDNEGSPSILIRALLLGVDPLSQSSCISWMQNFETAVLEKPRLDPNNNEIRCRIGLSGGQAAIGLYYEPQRRLLGQKQNSQGRLGHRCWLDSLYLKGQVRSASGGLHDRPKSLFAGHGLRYCWCGPGCLNGRVKSISYG